MGSIGVVNAVVNSCSAGDERDKDVDAVGETQGRHTLKREEEASCY